MNGIPIFTTITDNSFIVDKTIRTLQNLSHENDNKNGS